MCHKGQVGECKILSPYIVYMPHIRYLLYFNLINIICSITVIVIYITITESFN
jgi:hypothetical protein